jgi:uncharacterized domain HDIG
MSKIKDVFNNIRHEYYEISKILAFIIVIVIVIWQIPRTGKFKYEYQKSKPWQHESLYAPFDFAIYKDNATMQAENQAAVKSVMPIFVYDEAGTKLSREAILSEFENQWPENSALNKEFNKKVLVAFFDSIHDMGIIVHNKEIDKMEPQTIVELVKNQVSYPTRLSDMNSLKDAAHKIGKWIDAQDYGVDGQLLSMLLLNGLHQNVSYNADLTKQSIDKALAAVSLTYGMVQKDELIVAEGEIVNDKSFAMLNSLRKEYEDNSLSIEGANKMRFSQILLVTLVFFLLFLYLKSLYRKDVFDELNKVNLLLIMMLIMIIPSFWIIKLHPSYILLMPISILTILTITFFDSRLAFATQIFTVLIVSLSVPNPFQYIFMQLVVCLVVIFSLVKHNSRISYFKASFLAFLAYVIVYVGFTLLSDAEIQLQVIGLLALNALFTLLSLPLILIFERIFGLTTTMTLLELSNTNSPLLRKLATKAPGTFQHSIQVANLCEEVLYEIGGDALLARTGALYHDIGKIMNPTYFIENQLGRYNSHNDISNVESAQIIISHVMDGITLAHKSHIPEQIVDFIRTHHGTRRAEYFYAMEKKENPGAQINEEDFTYHGPIPFSRETAVLMIADSVEAASRSMTDPDEEKISALVENIVNKQIEAQQFENSDLTMRDFTTIKKVLKKNLMNVYHVRIAYPD